MLKKGFLTGLLLFGIFFGAANLIFPPALGLASGEHFVPAILGFIISGVGLAIITLILGTFRPDGYLSEISEKFSPTFAIVLLSALYLTIGPFFAIPRTAATSFSIGVEPLTSQFSYALPIFTVVYFGCAYVLSLNPGQLLNRVGKILTPIFALLIISLVVIGALTYGQGPSNVTTTAYQNGQAFGTGIIEGYNTLDALAAVAFCIIAMSTLKQFGFKSKKDYLATTTFAGVVTAIAFSVLYIGLAFLGNKFPVNETVTGNAGVYILSATSKALFGTQGQLFLGAMVILTCFTTTVGLIVATAEFFNNIFPKVSYRHYVSAFTLIGFAISNFGLNNVIAFSVPVLLVLYPIIIAIVMIIILNKFIPFAKLGMQLAMAVVVTIAILSVLASQFNITAISQLIAALPFAKESMPWLVPLLAALVLAALLPNAQKGKAFDFDALQQ